MFLKYKTCLIGRGILQKFGVDYSKTFNLIIKNTIIRVFLTLMLFKGWKVRQMNVNNAFLNEDLLEDVDMCQSLGFETSDPQLVC